MIKPIHATWNPMSPNNSPSVVQPGSSDFPEISALSHHELDLLLAEAEQARLEEIDRYWTLCQSDPKLAQSVIDDAAPILADVFHLAHDRFDAPKPGALACLSKATARLLQVEPVRAALVDVLPVSPLADPVDTLWENGRVVALKRVEGKRVVVLRYDGQLFNPGTVPEEVLVADQDCFIVCELARDDHENEYEILTAYVIGLLAGGKWNAVQVGLRARSDLMRDLEAMETLAECGRLSGAPFDARPFADFPTGRDALIARIRARKARLRLADAISPAQQSNPDIDADAL
ncbi:hypothetical protein G4G28_10920 [Massilia sp. Dwa41.01b]|uniref:hypothetical protein n=1 Tax=unclassified Massilia TaxID=2609279 RepID=UPI0015FF3DBE|nr:MULTISPECIES: hypothetical protein [unclassified Massilia]QNA88868.1 hypothetical protein G4G28_10920 [Massilia sp. Dwa41.01b]QNA99761.1 hypothetical protein G4G31_14565 [Massilia sp. Se16.2.3]